MPSKDARWRAVSEIAGWLRRRHRSVAASFVSPGFANVPKRPGVQGLLMYTQRGLCRCEITRGPAAEFEGWSSARCRRRGGREGCRGSCRLARKRRRKHPERAGLPVPAACQGLDSSA